jgi:hypothetical protein
MNLFIKTLSVTIVLLISSCGVPQADYEKLKSENVQLKQDLEDCKFGEEKLVAKIEVDYTNKKYNRVKMNTALFFDKFPESSKVVEFKKMLDIIQKEEIVFAKKKKKQELAEKKKKEAAEKERIRLTNLNNTGIWDVTYYVDDFGEATKQGYIRNTKKIRGTFSNTATQDSKLDVRFLISNDSDISIKLYEYAGNNPVKAYSTKLYKVLIQDDDGNRFKATAKNYSERLSFDKVWSREIHKALMKGGTIKFRIIEEDAQTNEYSFNIRDAGFYDNAYRKLHES